MYKNTLSSFSSKFSYVFLVITQLDISLEYSGNFSKPLIEKLESLACLENEDASVNPLKEHLLTI